MLCLPEFDTYRILPKYAGNPDDPRYNLALHLLKHRVTASLHWRVLNCRVGTEDNLQELLRFIMGRYGEEGGQKTDFTKMNTTELMDFYKKAVESVGYQVDPALFIKKEAPDGRSTDSNS